MDKLSVVRVLPDFAKKVRNLQGSDKVKPPFHKYEERVGTGKATCRACGDVIGEGEPTMYYEHGDDKEKPWLRTRGTIHAEECNNDKDWTKCPKKDCGTSVPNEEWSTHWREHRYEKAASSTEEPREWVSWTKGYQNRGSKLHFAPGDRTVCGRKLPEEPAFYVARHAESTVLALTKKDICPRCFAAKFEDKEGGLWGPKTSRTWTTSSNTSNTSNLKLTPVTTGTVTYNTNSTNANVTWTAQVQKSPGRPRPLSPEMMKWLAMGFHYSPQGRTAASKVKEDRERRDSLQEEISPEYLPSIHETPALDLGNGYKVVPLKTLGDAKYEGVMMSHCLGNPEVHKMFRDANRMDDDDWGGDFGFPSVTPDVVRDYFENVHGKEVPDDVVEHITSRGGSQLMSLRDGNDFPKATWWEPKGAPPGTSVREVAGFANQGLKPKYEHRVRQYMRHSLERAGMTDGKFEHVGTLEDKDAQDEMSLIYAPMQHLHVHDLPKIGDEYKGQVYGSTRRFPGDKGTPADDAEALSRLEAEEDMTGKMDRACYLGNHSACPGCGCDHHARTEFSGACEDGDHNTCRMEDCPCPHHHMAKRAHCGLCGEDRVVDPPPDVEMIPLDERKKKKRKLDTTDWKHVAHIGEDSGKHHEDDLEADFNAPDVKPGPPKSKGEELGESLWKGITEIFGESPTHCPRCGTHETSSLGKLTDADGFDYEKMQCNGCGKKFDKDEAGSGIDFTTDEPQIYHDEWAKEDREVQFAGTCFGCGRRTYHIEGGGDPRGPCGEHTSYALSAAEANMKGPDIPLCATCGEDGDKYRQAMDYSEKIWDDARDPDEMKAWDASGAKNLPCSDDLSDPTKPWPQRAHGTPHDHPGDPGCTEIHGASCHVGRGTIPIDKTVLRGSPGFGYSWHCSTHAACPDCGPVKVQKKGWKNSSADIGQDPTPVLPEGYKPRVDDLGEKSRKKNQVKQIEDAGTDLEQNLKDMHQFAGFKVAMPFHPNREYYKADWFDLPTHVYHVAPQSARESIEKHGLDPTGRTHNLVTQHAMWSDNHYTPEVNSPFHYRPEATYVLGDKHAAAYMAEEYRKRRGEPQDVWEVNTDSLRAAQSNPEHKTDVIRDPELLQSYWEEEDEKAPPETRSFETADDSFNSHENFGEEIGLPNGGDFRAWAFEKVHPDHIKRVKGYEFKDSDEWDEEDYDEHRTDHPEEWEDEDEDELYRSPRSAKVAAPLDDQGYHSLMTDGGFTLHDPDGVGPQVPGYIVATKGHEQKASVQGLTPQVLEQYRLAHADALHAGDDSYWGGWNNDEEDGKAYLDVVRHFPSRDEASRFANTQYQQTFFRMPKTLGDDDEGDVEDANVLPVGLAKRASAGKGAHLTILHKESGSRAYAALSECLQGHPRRTARHAQPQPKTPHPRTATTPSATDVQTGGPRQSHGTRGLFESRRGANAPANPRQHEAPDGRNRPERNNADFPRSPSDVSYHEATQGFKTISVVNIGSSPFGKELKKVRDHAESLGWTVDPTSKGLMFKAPPDLVQPGVKGMVLTHDSPSDHRAFKKFLRDMKNQGGFIWPPEKAKLREQKKQPDESVELTHDPATCLKETQGVETSDMTPEDIEELHSLAHDDEWRHVGRA